MIALKEALAVHAELIEATGGSHGVRDQVGWRRHWLGPSPLSASRNCILMPLQKRLHCSKAL